MALKSSNRKQRRFKRVVLWAGIVVALAVFFSAIYTSVFAITGVDIRGAKHTDVVAVHDAVDGFTHGYRYLIVPQANLFLYPKSKIRSEILKTYPSVESIDMHIDMHKKLVVDIKDRKALGVWCADVCYFYDEHGVVFKKSFSYTGPVFTTWNTASSTSLNLLDSIPCQDLCTDSVFLEFLRTYHIEKATIVDDMVELQSADGYTIKSSFSATTTISHMLKVVAKNPDFLQGVVYIDVRLPNKVFYKEKEI